MGWSWTDDRPSPTPPRSPIPSPRKSCSSPRLHPPPPPSSSPLVPPAASEPAVVEPRGYLETPEIHVGMISISNPDGIVEFNLQLHINFLHLVINDERYKK